MIDTRMLPGHAEARELAVCLASLRGAPPAGLDVLSSLPWDRIHSIAWSGDAAHPVIVVETMRQRQTHGSRTVLRAPLAPDHACRSDFYKALGALTEAHPDATLSARTMIAYPGWEVSATMRLEQGAEEISIWGCDESLAIASGELSDFIVQRDADERDRGMYAANALIRVAARLEKMVADQTESYHRHWTRVDAEILRRAALRENPALDPDFVPRISLAA